MRKLALKNGIWQWKIGKGGHIVIKNPQGKKFLTNEAAVSGLSWDTLERMAWKGNAFAFTPGVIKEYIEEKLMEDKL